jgi:hypothetical protein
MKIERNKRRRKNKKKKCSDAKRKRYNTYRLYRERAKYVHSYSDALNYFLPHNLFYLISDPHSPFYIECEKPFCRKNFLLIKIPSHFSVISNPKETVRCLKNIVESLVFQKAEKIYLDYAECVESDLLTQIYLDSILSDWHIFMHNCQKASLYRYVLISELGGKHYKNDRIMRMVNSVGSPAILLNRTYIHKDIIPFRLRFHDEDMERAERVGSTDEIETTELIEYVNKCLSSIGKTLTPTAQDELGIVIGEAVINATEHSTLKSRYLIGFFEEYHESKGHYGYLNLVIMNYGKTIYEKFKYPSASEKINTDIIKQMQELSNHFVTHSLFSSAEFTEEQLWTLYALQQGVSIIPDAKRGSGTIKFIDSFLKLKDENDATNVSRMYLLSGNVLIEFDGKYKLKETRDSNGYVSRMAFNTSGSLREKPDSKYVRVNPVYFPGTAIYARIRMNSNNIQNEND